MFPKNTYMENMIYQIEEVLPRTKWEEVTVREKYEQLVEVQETERLVYGRSIHRLYADNSYYVRKMLADMLIMASVSLPPGYKLVLIEGVRNMEKQRMHWNDTCKSLSKNNPLWSIEKIEREAGMLVARPAPLANHNCGGAVDVALFDSRNELVDMGTYPQDLSDKNLAKMRSELITEQQKRNRAILRTAMIKNGFVYYPGEWWHYCYGDRMWAAYTGRREAQYGPIQELFNA
jgi:D-alanyl-D-alanine dipeptidase